MQCQSTIPNTFLCVTFSLTSFPTPLGAGKRIPWPRHLVGINKWEGLISLFIFALLHLTGFKCGEENLESLGNARAGAVFACSKSC